MCANGRGKGEKTEKQISFSDLPEMLDANMLFDEVTSHTCVAAGGPCALVQSSPITIRLVKKKEEIFIRKHKDKQSVPSALK